MCEMPTSGEAVRRIQCEEHDERLRLFGVEYALGRRYGVITIRKRALPLIIRS